MRVASALGVSAEMSGPPEAALDAFGDVQLIVPVACAVVAPLAVEPPPLPLMLAVLVPLAVEPPLPLLPPVPLLLLLPLPALAADAPLALLAALALPVVDALPLVPPLPPPPQPARINNREESSNG
ncbi:hypothetical protein D0B32_13835 [Paraburkholderia sp. DHOC27]|nr:hypothetical protein D0B32_13835 [Paraburkholderia sp. DHOC27]